MGSDSASEQQDSQGDGGPNGARRQRGRDDGWRRPSVRGPLEQLLCGRERHDRHGAAAVRSLGHNCEHGTQRLQR